MLLSVVAAIMTIILLRNTFEPDSDLDNSICGHNKTHETQANERTNFAAECFERGVGDR